MTNIANTDQYAAWNGDSGQRWAEDADRRDRVLAPIADALLDAARLRPGEHVVDVGCGCGATTLAAARAVAPTGEAHGVDISALLLAVARERAESDGLTNVRFEQADAQTHRLPAGAADVVISRFGTMFFGDADAAFAGLATALRAGGRLCMATWQPLEANDWLTIPGAALLRYGSLPESDGPGMFAQSDPPAIITLLRIAGLTTVDVTPVAVVMPLGADPGEAVDYLAGTGIGRAVLDTVPDADKPAALEAVRSVLAQHQTPRGVELDAAIWITSATRS
jgi:SAM-dependent methyltransferase